MARGSQARSLSPEQIVSAALRLIEQRGLSRLTMRAVSSELGVTPMAIYYHVDDKDELIRLVVERVQESRIPVRLDDDGWEASLRRYLISSWESLARYPGLGAHMIELPTLGVTPDRARDGIHFFEESGFSPANAPLAWSFALTYIHGRISVDARLARQPEAPRLNGLHAPDYVEFGVEAVIRGLRPLRQADAGEVDPGPEAAVTTGS